MQACVQAGLQTTRGLALDVTSIGCCGSALIALAQQFCTTFGTIAGVRNAPVSRSRLLVFEWSQSVL